METFGWSVRNEFPSWFHSYILIFFHLYICIFTITLWYFHCYMLYISRGCWILHFLFIIWLSKHTHTLDNMLLVSLAGWQAHYIGFYCVLSVLSWFMLMFPPNGLIDDLASLVGHLSLRIPQQASVRHWEIPQLGVCECVSVWWKRDSSCVSAHVRRARRLGPASCRMTVWTCHATVTDRAKLINFIYFISYLYPVH